MSAVARWEAKAGTGSSGGGGGEYLGGCLRRLVAGVRMLWEVLTGIRSRYFWRIRSASALRFSKGCSSLNLDRILVVVGEVVARMRCGGAGCSECVCLSVRRPGSALLKRSGVQAGSMTRAYCQGEGCDGVDDGRMKV